MIVKGLERSHHTIFVPDFAINGEGQKVAKSGEIFSVEEGKLECAQECKEFELPDDKWFAVADSIIIRFPKDKEWVWRVQRAQEMVGRVSTNPGSFSGPEDRISALKNAAYLCGFSLDELVERLKEARNNNEDLVAVFKRIKESEK